MKEDVLLFCLNHSSAILPHGGDNLQHIHLTLILQLRHPNISSNKHARTTDASTGKWREETGMEMYRSYDN